MMQTRFFRICGLLILGAVLLVRSSLPAMDVPDDFTSRLAAGGQVRFHYPPRLERMSEAVEEIIGEAAQEMAVELGLEGIDTMDVLLAPDDESYRRFHRGMLPEWSAAFSNSRIRVIGINVPVVLRSSRPLETVVRHELSHLLLAQRLDGAPCPTWFAEGLAMIQSHEWSFSDQWSLMRSVWRKRMPYLDELEGAFPPLADDAALAYQLSYVAVDKLFRDNPQDLVTLTAFTRDLADFDRAFVSTFGETPLEYSARFYDMMNAKYRTAGTFVQASPYWLGLALLFILAYVVKRRRGRRKLEEWADE